MENNTKYKNMNELTKFETQEKQQPKSLFVKNKTPLCGITIIFRKLNKKNHILLYYPKFHAKKLTRSTHETNKKFQISDSLKTNVDRLIISEVTDVCVAMLDDDVFNRASDESESVLSMSKQRSSAVGGGL